MRHRAIVGLLLILSVFLAAAGVASAQEEKAGSSAQALQRAVELYRAGQKEEALSRLRGFVVRYPGSPLLPDAYLYLARIFRDNGQMEEALLYLGRIPPERRSPEVRLIEGVALIDAGQLEQGVEMLQALEGADLAPADRQLRLRSLADGNARLERPLSALAFLHRAWSVAGAREREILLQRAHLLLRDRFADEELGEATFMFAGTPIGEDARLQQALRAFARGDSITARDLAQQVVQSPVLFPYRRDAALLLERLMGRSSSERVVGVILPLSGRYGTFGTLVRKGMELAFQVHADSGVRLEFVDIDADAEKSVRAVADLASRPAVMAIAGPLTGGAAAVAAAQAAREQIPLISLSQREGIPETGPHVFRLSLTPQAQIGALVRHVMEERGLRTFAVLAPDNRIGQEMASLFVREVEERGGEVLVRQSYPEAATDFKTEVWALVGRKPDDPEPPSDKKPAPAFEALFVPDFADRIALIAPQLAYYGLTGVQLLGINGWNSPELTRLAGPYVEGAIFVDGFFRNSTDAIVREFVELYQQKYGDPPSVLEAQGFDVINILLSLASDPSVRTRDELREALARLQEFPGIGGPTSFDAVGEAQRDLFVLQFRSGEIVQIR